MSRSTRVAFGVMALLAAPASSAAAEESPPPPSTAAREPAERLPRVFVGVSPLEPITMGGIGGTLEVRLLHPLSLGVGGAAGPVAKRQPQESSYEELTGSVLAYVAGDFRNGIQMGLQAAYRAERGGFRSEWNDAVQRVVLDPSESSSRRSFFGVGPVFGIKVGARFGLSANLQLALIMGSQSRTLDQLLGGSSNPVTESGFRLRPALTGNVGWSF